MDGLLEYAAVLLGFVVVITIIQAVLEQFVFMKLNGKFWDIWRAGAAIYNPSEFDRLFVFRLGVAFTILVPMMFVVESRSNIAIALMIVTSLFVSTFITQVYAGLTAEKPDNDS
jgi:heme/copper-type cytochrome/quinol oxidase subunit 4